jgi:hypothetical protein
MAAMWANICFFKLRSTGERLAASSCRLTTATNQPIHTISRSDDGQTRANDRTGHVVIAVAAALAIAALAIAALAIAALVSTQRRDAKRRD